MFAGQVVRGGVPVCGAVLSRLFCSYIALRNWVKCGLRLGGSGLEPGTLHFYHAPGDADSAYPTVSREVAGPENVHWSGKQGQVGCAVLRQGRGSLFLLDKGGCISRVCFCRLLFLYQHLTKNSPVECLL